MTEENSTDTFARVLRMTMVDSPKGEVQTVGEGKRSVGEVKLSVGLTGCHSATTEITIAWLK